MDFGGVDFANADSTYGVNGISDMYNEALESDGYVSLEEFAELLKELMRQLIELQTEGQLTDTQSAMLETLQDTDNPLGLLANSEKIDDQSLYDYLSEGLTEGQQVALLNQFGDRFEDIGELIDAIASGDLSAEETLEALEQIGVFLDDLEDAIPEGNLLIQATSTLSDWIDGANEDLAELVTRRNFLNKVDALDNPHEQINILQEALNAANDPDSEYHIPGIEDILDQEQLDSWAERAGNLATEREALTGEDGTLTKAQDELDAFEAEHFTDGKGPDDLDAADRQKYDELKGNVESEEAKLRDLERREDDLQDDISTVLTNLSAQEGAEWQRLKDQLVIMSELTSALVRAYADAFKAISRNIGQ